VTSASAFADAFFVTAVVAVAVVDAALTTDPSLGEENDDVVTGCAAGGDADVPVALAGWFGTAIRIAYALAVAPAERTSSPALVETNARSASRAGRARRRRTASKDATDTG
jgi:hypothetical protein